MWSTASERALFAVEDAAERTEDFIAWTERNKVALSPDFRTAMAMAVLANRQLAAYLCLAEAEQDGREAVAEAAREEIRRLREEAAEGE